MKYWGSTEKNTLPFPRCAAPGCGDKIKDDVRVRLVDEDGNVFFIEESCVGWFENGHPDYGCPRGPIEFIAASEEK